MNTPSMESLRSASHSRLSSYVSTEDLLDTASTGRSGSNIWIVTAVLMPTFVVLMFSSKQADLGLLIANVASMFLVGWLMKLCLEVPVGWYEDLSSNYIRASVSLQDTKSSLEGYKKQFKLRKKSLGGIHWNVTDTDAFRSLMSGLEEENRNLNRHLVELLIWRRLSLLLCLVSPVLGGFIMKYSRSYIVVVSDTQKLLIFSNLNIVAFLIFGYLRMINKLNDPKRNAVTQTENEKLTTYNQLNEIQIKQNEFMRELDCFIEEKEMIIRDLNQKIDDLQDFTNQLYTYIKEVPELQAIPGQPQHQDQSLNVVTESVMNMLKLWLALFIYIPIRFMRFLGK